MNKLAKLFVCIVLLVCALIGAKVMIKTAPKAERRKPPKRAALVQCQPLAKTNEQVVVQVTGTVKPAQEVMLQARLTSEVQALHPAFIEGGLVNEGDILIELDKADFELALTQAKAELQRATAAYKDELGRQAIAKHEWELLGNTDVATALETELALRKPQLKNAEATLNAAKAAVKKAELNLSRTELRAPFNAIVMDRRTQIGSQATPQSILGQLAGTDRYWVKASISIDRLPWVSIPGSQAVIRSNSGSEHKGQVIKLMALLEQKGRMAQLLIEIDDPFCRTPEKQGMQPLLLGEFVHVSITGKQLTNVFHIPRSALREDNNIWIDTPGETLDIRPVEVKWKTADYVLIDGALKDGEKLITSDIVAPMQGMDVNSGIRKQDKRKDQRMNQKSERAGAKSKQKAL